MSYMMKQRKPNFMSDLSNSFAGKNVFDFSKNSIIDYLTRQLGKEGIFGKDSSRMAKEIYDDLVRKTKLDQLNGSKTVDSNKSTEEDVPKKSPRKSVFTEIKKITS